MKTITTWALLALFLILGACASGPNPADVQADRDRWTAVRDVTADGTVDATEAPLVTTLLVEWDKKLTADEAAAGRQRDAKTILTELLRVYGAAAVQVWLAPELQARAPDVFRLIDQDSNGVLTEAEILSIDPASPVFALVVATTSQHLLERRR